MAKGKREEMQDDGGCRIPKRMSVEEKRLFDKGLQKIGGRLYPLGEHPYISIEEIKKVSKKGLK
jgi:hypothetical protein